MSSTEPPPHAVAQEIAAEQAHVDRVYAHLDVAQSSAHKAAQQSNELYEINRADYLREEDTTAVFERDAFSFQAAKRLAVLDSEHEGLVFGRLDHNDGDVRYIGRLGVRDDNYEPLVIDWRAPASEPFYRATPSKPMNVARRRVLRCRGEQVIGIEDDLIDGGTVRNDLIVVGEGALMASLARARGDRMRDIVATIQSEQDQAIRAPFQGVTIISGGPGTGKTVVALHRAAYLLYTYRRRFEHGGVLVVGPSGVFMNYIERVLPSLGEDSVTLRAIGQVSNDVVGHLATERVDEPAAAAVKGSLAMAELLKRVALEPQSDPDTSLRVTVKGEVFTLKASKLRSIRRKVLNNQVMNRGKQQAVNAILDAMWAQKPDDFEVDRDAFNDFVTDQAAFTMFLHAWWPAVTPETLLVRLSHLPFVTKVADGILTPAQQKTLVDSYVGGPDQWTVADMALLDELFALVGPMPRSENDDPDPTEFLLEGAEISELVTMQDRFARVVEDDPNDPGFRIFNHVLVDEAQDVTPMQWRMLRRRGPQASWTIVGDPAQSSWHDPSETERALNDLIGRSASRRFRMSTNYRSPAEVFNLASAIVQEAYPNADVPVAVRSTGVLPMLLSTDESDLPSLLASQIRSLAQQVEGSLGVIAPHSRIPALTALLEREFANDEGLRSRLVLVTPLEAKGLEYDAVVVVDPDGIVQQTSGGVRVLYVALTRPTQRLVTIDVNPHRRPGAWQAPLNDHESATA